MEDYEDSIEDKYKKVLELIRHPTERNYDEALRIMNEILNRESEDEYKDLELNIRRQLAIVHFDTTNYDEAINEYSKVLYLYDVGRRFEVLKDEKIAIDNQNIENKIIYNYISLAWTHHDLAVILTVMKKYAAAKDHFEAAIDLVGRAGDEATEAWFRNDLGWYHYENHEYKKAIEQYKQVLMLDIEETYKAYPLFYSGLAYFRWDRDNCAYKIRDCFEQSMKLWKSKADMNAEDEIFMGYIFMNMGRLDLHNKDSRRAEDNLDSALKLYEKNKDYIDNYTPRRKAVILENIANTHYLYGKLHFDEGSLEAAKNEFELARKTSESIKTKAKYYNNLGCLHFSRDERDKAVEAFILAIKTDPTSEVISNNLNLALKSTKKAISFSDFWFGPAFDGTSGGGPGRRRVKEILGHIKGIMAQALATILIITIIVNFIIIMSPGSKGPFSGWGYVNETTTEENYNYSIGGDWGEEQAAKTTSKTINKRSHNFEYNLVLIGLCMLILLLPWTKSFEAGNIKMELKETPVMVTGGAGGSPASPTMDV